MVATNLFWRAALAAFLLALPVNAQKIMVLPTSGSSVSVFSDQPFQASPSITANVGVFSVLSNPAGTMYFFVSSANVVVTDGSGNSLQAPLAFGSSITAAALTADARRLLITAGSGAAGSLYIFDITLGTATQTGVVTIGSTPSDVTGTLDSTSALLVTSSGLASVDVVANALNGTLALPGVGAGSGVVGGPNGLFYVNAQSVLYEVNPRTLTIRNTIPVNGFPNKPSFSPDGGSILMANPSAKTAADSAAMVVSVATHAVTAQINYWGLKLTKLIWAPNNQLYALGPGVLVQFPSNFGSISEASFPVVGQIPTVLDVFSSTEFPTVEGGSGARYLYVVAPTTLYRIDQTPPGGATPGEIVETVPIIGAQPLKGAYFIPLSSGVLELTKFGDQQNVVIGAVSLPLVVRAVDSSGRPAFGGGVVFSSSTLTYVGQPMISTNSSGLAQAIIQAPSTVGAYSDLVTVAGSQAVFTVNVVSGGGGIIPPSGGGSGAGLSKVIGDGQVGLGNSLVVEPLEVYYGDANGNPVANATVTFAISGQGSLLGFGCTASVTGSLACLTNTNGVAYVNMEAPDLLETQGSWIESTVTASVTLANGNTQTVTFIESGVPSQAYGTNGPLQGENFNTPGLNGTVTVQAGKTATGAVQFNIFPRSGPQQGQPMPNVGIHTSTTDLYNSTAAVPSVYCNGITPLSDSTGLASCDLVAPATLAAGTYPIWMVVGGNQGFPMTVVVTPAPPVIRVPTVANPVSGNNQSASTGQAFTPLVAVVNDQLGSPMANIPVTWTVVSGPATLASPTSTVTDANGHASTGVLAGAKAGPVVVKMTASTATPAVFSLTVIPTVGSMTKVSGTDNQSVVIGQTFQPVSVLLTDPTGAVLPGIVVNFAVTAGVATPGSTTSATSAQGVASATFASTTTAGQITITASAGGKSVTFTLTARQPGVDPSTVVFLNGASFQPGVPIGGVVAIRGVGLTTGLTIPAGTCLSAIPDGNLQRGLPTTLAGVQIVFSTRAAPIFGICVNADGTEQVNVQAPFELAPASITVDIKTGVGTAEMDTYIPNVAVSATEPGIFEYNVDPNTRVALAQRSNGTIVSPTNPAKAGETIRLYVTGIGWVMDSTDKQVASNQPGYPGQVAWNVATAVTLNNAPVTGTTAEYAQNLIGVFVVSFQVPAPQNAAATVPISVTVTPLNGSPVTSLASNIPVSQ
ncbi:MAG: Ig-like domain-containing protein [Bryobacteraceae bacterium]